MTSLRVLCGRTVLSRAIAVAVVVLAALWGAPAWAQKTDIVTLINGDRITGEIKNLSRGRLELSTDDAGTIEIEWDKIAKVQSPRLFEITASDGRRRLGSFGTGTDGVVMVVGPAGVVSFPMTSVTRIAPIGTSFWAKMDGSFDAGFSYTRSSGLAQINLNSTASYRRPDFMVRFTGSATLTGQSDGDEDERDDRAAADLSYVRYRGPNWFVATGVSGEANESLGLLLRSQVSSTIGRRLVDTHHAYVDVSAGLVANDERAVDAEPQQNLEGLLVFRWSYYAYDRPRTNVDVVAQYFPSLSNWGRQRLQFDSSLRREVWKDFFLSLNVYVSFDSEPPTENAYRTDVGITTSAGWSF